jgi:LysR family transcriptional regulator of gallate degradation
VVNAVDLNLRHLRLLIAIDESGSVSAVARSALISQPALTQALAGLERAFGATLFHRSAAGVVATADGERIILRVRRALNHLARACRDLGKIRAGLPLESYLTMAHVRGLTALAESGGFTRAAEAVGISPPSLHRAVRDIERIAGASLVQRKGRGVELTRAGERLARSFSIAVTELTAATEEAREAGGHLSIGAMALSRSLLLPNTLANLLEARSDIEVDVVEGSYLELVELLRSGRIDLLIGALRDHATADLVQERLFDDSLTIIGRAEHPLAGKVAGFDQLAAYPWIVARRASGLLDRWQKMFDHSEKARPKAPIQCGSVALIRGVLARSDFLTLLSTAQVSAEIDAGTLVRIESVVPDTARTIGVISRRDWYPTKLQNEFILCLRQTAHGQIV